MSGRGALLMAILERRKAEAEAKAKEAEAEAKAREDEAKAKEDEAEVKAKAKEAEIEPKMTELSEAVKETKLDDPPAKLEEGTQKASKEATPASSSSDPVEYRGSVGRDIALGCNFFRLDFSPSGGLFEHRVTFSPPVDDRKARFRMFWAAHQG